MWFVDLPRACGMRWRKASPNSPPEAKLSSTLSRFWCWSLFDWTGIRNRMRKGAALISRVAPTACRQGWRRVNMLQGHEEMQHESKREAVGLKCPWHKQEVCKRSHSKRTSGYQLQTELHFLAKHSGSWHNFLVPHNCSEQTKASIQSHAPVKAVWDFLLLVATGRLSCENMNKSVLCADMLPSLLRMFLMVTDLYQQ